MLIWSFAMKKLSLFFFFLSTITAPFAFAMNSDDDTEHPAATTFSKKHSLEDLFKNQLVASATSKYFDLKDFQTVLSIRALRSNVLEEIVKAVSYERSQITLYPMAVYNEKFGKLEFSALRFNPGFSLKNIPHTAKMFGVNLSALFALSLKIKRGTASSAMVGMVAQSDREEESYISGFPIDDILDSFSFDYGKMRFAYSFLHPPVSDSDCTAIFNYRCMLFRLAMRLPGTYPYASFLQKKAVKMGLSDRSEGLRRLEILAETSPYAQDILADKLAEDGQSPEKLKALAERRNLRAQELVVEGLIKGKYGFLRDSEQLKVLAENGNLYAQESIAYKLMDQIFFFREIDAIAGFPLLRESYQQFLDLANSGNRWAQWSVVDTLEPDFLFQKHYKTLVGLAEGGDLRARKLVDQGWIDGSSGIPKRSEHLEALVTMGNPYAKKFLETGRLPSYDHNIDSQSSAETDGSNQRTVEDFQVDQKLIDGSLGFVLKFFMQGSLEESQ